MYELFMKKKWDEWSEEEAVYSKEFKKRWTQTKKDREEYKKYAREKGKMDYLDPYKRGPHVKRIVKKGK